MIILVTHGFVKGNYEHNNPSSALKDLLEKENIPFVMIKHSLNGSTPSNIFYGTGSKKGMTNVLFPFKIHIAWLRYITDFLTTIVVTIVTKIKFNEDVIFIGIDPLNAISGVILKFLHIINKTVFFSVDYTSDRFPNKLMNSIYQFLDRYCSFKSDEVWNVSTRIVNMRLANGVEKRKVFLIPNTPPQEYRNFSNNEKEKFHLISLGLLSGQLDYEGLFLALKELILDYPEILLKIVGTGDYESKYKALVKDLHLEKNVVFMGPLDHSDALKEISLSGIGLALYNGKLSYNYYGDSMKCREYLFYGLPVLTTDTHSTVEEIREYKAGVIVQLDPKEYVSAIKEILNNYDYYSKNSFELGRKYDNVRRDNVLRLLSPK